MNIYPRGGTLKSVCIQAVADGSICLSASTEGVSGGDMAICTPSAGQDPATSRLIGA